MEETEIAPVIKDKKKKKSKDKERDLGQIQVRCHLILNVDNLYEDE